ncbi:DedA family protein [Stenotrophobium rhamnosiphilum]|uniref:DedA family protein n=1 Tax=Stenotrophobium rhamnosiphilum TaxID=2029166 RepID=A0A2T5MIZ0_9GAMM|nr:DedA family protein [Stenotrophobium rhamnosiphilum]
MDWYLAQLATGGYPLIVLLMAIESSFLPLPSELVIPPAAILASRGGELTYVGIVIAGTVGSWIGATFMYWGSRWLGRPLAMRYGRYFMISPEKIEAAERWAAQYGAAGVFISRLLPVIRHLVGIPFGIVKMNFLRYSIFTILGSAIWCTVLTVIGVHAGQDEALMRGDLHQITLWIIVGAAILGALYYFLVHRAMKKT